MSQFTMFVHLYDKDASEEDRRCYSYTADTLEGIKAQHVKDGDCAEYYPGPVLKLSINLAEFEPRRLITGIIAMLDECFAPPGVTIERIDRALVMPE